MFDDVVTTVLANGWTALDAAREAATARGYDALVLSSSVEGEASEAGRTHAAIARECVETGNPASPPVVLSGGETTVTLVDDPGQGGPNQEFVVSAAAELDDEPVVVAASTRTESTARRTPPALSWPRRDRLRRRQGCAGAKRRRALLADVDALLRTGPSGTNVNDLRLFVVGE